MSRLVGNSARTGQVASTLVWALMDLVPPLGAIVALALIDPWLCLTFLVGLPVVLAVVRAFVRDASGINERYYDAQGQVAARLMDALSGIRTITAAGTVDREVRRVLEPLPELRRHGYGMWGALARVSSREALAIPLLESPVLAVAGLELARGRITPGQVLAAGEYVVLATGISSLVASANRLALARGTAGRVAEVLAEPPMAYGGEPLPEGPGRLEFRGVTVRGPDGAAVLENLWLTVPPGALVAVAGRSGSGKSVLAALGGRLLDPDEGEVLLDGLPLRRLDRHALRQAIAYGFERPVLLGDTFADAIGFGPAPAGPDEVARGAAAARADAFIRRMPEGYGTRLADAPIAGGERAAGGPGPGVRPVGAQRAGAGPGRCRREPRHRDRTPHQPRPHRHGRPGGPHPPGGHAPRVHRGPRGPGHLAGRGRRTRAGPPPGPVGGPGVPGRFPARGAGDGHGEGGFRCRGAGMSAGAGGLLRESLHRRRGRFLRLTGWSLVQAVPASLSGWLVARAVDDGFLVGRTGQGLAWLTRWPTPSWWAPGRRGT